MFENYNSVTQKKKRAAVDGNCACQHEDHKFISGRRQESTSNVWYNSS